MTRRCGVKERMELWVCVPQPPACCQTSSAASAVPLLTPRENWLLHRRAKFGFLEQAYQNSVIATMTNTVLTRKFISTY